MLNSNNLNFLGSQRHLVVGGNHDTPVAFRDENGLKVSENIWSTTTSRHLNAIDGGNKKNRIPNEQFKIDLEQMIKKHGLE